MTISSNIRSSIEKSSWIRRMFEEGAKLKAQYGADKVFDFSIGNPDVPPPDQFISTLSEAARDNTAGIHGYMPNAGYPAVRRSIADHINKEQGLSLTENNILMSCGAAGGLNTVLKAIINPGEEVIVIRPYFVEYGFYIANHGGVTVEVPSKGDFSLDIEAIKKAINDKTKAIIINSPNNPTGRIYSIEEIKKLAEILTDSSVSGQTIYLLSDEPYRDIVYEDIHVPFLFHYYPHTITVTSFSKTLSIPGERIGYVAVNPQCNESELLMNGIVLANRILGFVNAPALMQRVITSCLDAKVDIETYRRRRDILASGLAAAGYSFARPDGAFYLFCASPIEDDVAFTSQLLKYNILVVPGTGFGYSGYFRISYCVDETVIQGSLPGFTEAINSINSK